MSGLRIHHPTARDCVLTVAHPGNAALGMRGKDLVIHLDGEGNSIVSTGVWERLQEATQSFLVLNEVPNPPTLRIESDGEPAPARRVFREQRDGTITDEQLLAVAQKFAPRGVTPRITHG